MTAKEMSLGIKTVVAAISQRKIVQYDGAAYRVRGFEVDNDRNGQLSLSVKLGDQNCNERSWVHVDYGKIEKQLKE